MELPNETELCEQVFLAQPKAHRVKYAEKHRIVETDMLKLQEFFEGCHDADVRTGTFAKILEGKKPQDEPKSKRSGRQGQDKPPAKVDNRDRRDRDRREYRPYERPYERRHQDDRPYYRDPPRSDHRDRDRYRDEKPHRDDRGYAKAAGGKDRKGGHHAHHVDTNNTRSRSRSRSTESSVKEVKRVRVSSPSRAPPRSPRSSSDDEEHYHVGLEQPMSEDDPRQWERKPPAVASAHGNGASTVASASSNNDGWTRKTSPAKTPSPPPEDKMTPEDLAMLRLSKEERQIIMPYADRHSQHKPRWYVEASREPCQINSQGEAIGLGSFFNRRPFDYTDEEMNLPQGHEDRIRTVDLLPEDRKRREQEDDDSVLPSDWLERTAEISFALDHDFGKGTWKRLMMGDLMTMYGCFYTGCTRHFQMIRAQEHHEHNLETNKAVKVIQEMNIKSGVPPNAGVDKFKQEQAQALQDHVDDLMKRFRAKSRRWLDRNHE